MKTTNNIMLLVFLFISSCSNYWEMQEDHLLPESIVLRRLTSEEIGITTFNSYKLIGKIDCKNLHRFPKYGMGDRGWEVTTWHKPNDMELRNLKTLLETNYSMNSISLMQISSIVNDEEILIAYTIDKDDPSLNNEDFKVHNWIDLYFLKLSKKSLFHLSYGKF